MLAGIALFAFICGRAAVRDLSRVTAGGSVGEAIGTVLLLALTAGLVAAGIRMTRAGLRMSPDGGDAATPASGQATQGEVVEEGPDQGGSRPGSAGEAELGTVDV